MLSTRVYCGVGPPGGGAAIHVADSTVFIYSFIVAFLLLLAGSGEVLSTRVYRGVGPPGGGAGVEVVSVGCNTHVAYLAAHEMSPCYVSDEQVRLWCGALHDGVYKCFKLI